MPPALSELKATLKTKLDAIDALNVEGATEEQLSQVDALLGETDSLREQITVASSQENRLARINAGKQLLTTPAPQTLSVTVPGVNLPAGPFGGDGAKLAAVPRYYGELALEKVPGVDRGTAERLTYGMGCFALGCLGVESMRREAEKLGFSFAECQLAAGTNVPTAGGYAVPDMIGAMVMYLKKAYGVARRNAEVVPMGNADVMKHPAINAGLTVYPITENRTTGTTESQLTFGEVELIARDFGIASRFSRKIANVIGIGNLLIQDMAYQYSLNEDNCAFNGDGTSTYNGIWGIKSKINDGNHTASIYTATGHVTFGALTLTDFVNMTALLPAFIGIDPKWYISKAGWAASMQPLAITTSYGDPTVAVRPSFLGYPVEFTEVLPTALTTLTGQITAFFGDLRLTAKLGDKEQLFIAQSEHRYIEFGQIGIWSENSFAWNAYRLGTTTAAGPMIALKMG